MTTIQACDLIVTLTAELRDEKVLRMNLEEDLRSTRELLSVALTVLHDFQVDPARQQRHHQQIVRDLRALLTDALHTEAA